MARISISIKNIENNNEKTFQFYSNQYVHEAKQTAINSLSSNLIDPFNYGLYAPGDKVKEGKFLQDERFLSDYGLNSFAARLELRYKRRNYRNVTFSSSRLKKLNTKKNQKIFLNYVRNGDIVKVNKYLNKGMDPNFYCLETGETPLTLAAARPKPHELVMCLISSGAHLDYRSRDSRTPLHKAAMCGNLDAIKLFLDLGSSANCRDQSGLTPLYLTVSYDTSAMCTERLLFDHATLGHADENGLQEIHQACRNGLSQHLEYLISYGADLNCTTRGGDTPLHMCAISGSESCARLLLFRGADSRRVNHAGETAHALALAHRKDNIVRLLDNFRPEDIVPLRSAAQLNDKRRMAKLHYNPLDKQSENKRFASMSHLPSNGITIEADGRSTQAYHMRPNTSSSSFVPSSPRRDPSPGKASYSGRPSNNNVPRAPLSSVYYGNVKDKLRSKSTTPDIVMNSPVYSKKLTSADSIGGNDTVRSRASFFLMLEKEIVNIPRAVVLQKSTGGFGFVLRGSLNVDRRTFEPSPSHPGTQYFGEIQQGSPADKAGILKGDYLLEINGTPVLLASHDEVVKLILKAGDTLAMKVMTVDLEKLQAKDDLSDTESILTSTYEDSMSMHSRRSDLSMHSSAVGAGAGGGGGGGSIINNGRVQPTYRVGGNGGNGNGGGGGGSSVNSGIMMGHTPPRLYQKASEKNSSDVIYATVASARLPREAIMPDAGVIRAKLKANAQQQQQQQQQTQSASIFIPNKISSNTNNNRAALGSIPGVIVGASPETNNNNKPSSHSSSVISTTTTTSTQNRKSRAPPPPVRDVTTVLSRSPPPINSVSSPSSPLNKQPPPPPPNVKTKGYPSHPPPPPPPPPPPSSMPPGVLKEPEPDYSDDDEDGDGDGNSSTGTLRGGNSRLRDDVGIRANPSSYSTTTLQSQLQDALKKREQKGTTNHNGGAGVRGGGGRGSRTDVTPL